MKVWITIEELEYDGSIGDSIKVHSSEEKAIEYKENFKSSVGEFIVIYEKEVE